jgi:hypothetical protein
MIPASERAKTGFIEHLQIVTTSNYTAIANSYTQQFTTARTVFSVCCVFTSRCLITASKAADPSTSVFTSLLPGDCLITKFYTCPAYNTSARTAQKISPNSSIVVSRRCRTDRVENTASQVVHLCLLGICCGHYLATAVVYRVIT